MCFHFHVLNVIQFQMQLSGMGVGAIREFTLMFCEG